MGKQHKHNDVNGLVYSTDPDFKLPEEEDATATLSPEDQKLRIWLDHKRRAGKTVTLVTGFQGSEKDLADLGKKLKNHCGTGGTAKEGEILIQGDQRDKVLQWLLQNKYRNSKKSGGN